MPPKPIDTTPREGRPAGNPARVSKKSAYHHGDLRQQLVKATRLLVEEKGPLGFSVAEAARSAGVSTAAPYRHFPDRHAMLDAVAADGIRRMVAAFDAAVANLPLGSVEAIAAIGRAYVSFAVTEPGVFRLMFAAHEDPSDEKMEAGEECYGRVLTQIAAYLGPRQDPATVGQTGLMLWTFVHGISFLTIDGKMERPDMPTDLDAIIRMGTERLLGPRPARG